MNGILNGKILVKVNYFILETSNTTQEFSGVSNWYNDGHNFGAKVLEYYFPFVLIESHSGFLYIVELIQ